MQFANFQFPFNILANQLPELPTGPALENVRAPLESGAGYETWQIALAILAFILVAIGLLWLYLRQRNKPAPPLPPEEAARAELNAAEQAADDERFALLCANALRRFLEARYKLPASCRTSAELCQSLPLSSDEEERLHAFLNACDDVKFAGQALKPEQRIELLDTAKEFVRTHTKTEDAA